MTVTGPEPGQHRGFDGWWLRNSVAEAFVIAEPHPRLVAFNLLGRASPLHVSRHHPFFGTRTWFLEPVETDESGLPALQPAVGDVTDAGSVQLTAGDEPATGLRLAMNIALDDHRPRLSVAHTLRNLRDTGRRMAVWAINAVEPTGIGLTAWRQDERRSLILFHDTPADAKSVHAEPAVLAVDYRVPPETVFCKVGTDTACGWGAFVWDGMALKSSVPFQPGAQYPEGGGTLTFFNSGPMEGGRFGEVENVGPLTDVAPGETVTLSQTLTLVDGLVGDDLAAWAEVIDRAD